MENSIDILDKIVKLIREEKFEDASKEFFEYFEREIVTYIVFRLKWNYDEAYSIFHDAYLLLQDKILENEIDSISKFTIYQTCKFIGANKFRKAIKEKEKLNKYFEEERNNLINEIHANTDLEVKLDSEYEGTAKIALQAFSLLKKQCQKMLVMKYVEGLNHEEMAKKIPEISNSRVSITLLSRCVKKWRSFIKKIKNG